jgi:hypothetical protein
MDHEGLIDPPLLGDFYNLSLGNQVAGLGGAYSLLTDDTTQPNTTIPMAVIGV